MNIPEEVSKVAVTTVEALKQTPATLALVVFNVIFIFVVGYLAISNSTRNERESERMHGLVSKAIAACERPDTAR